MLVGEAPGPEEDREGKPFAGESGALLGKMLLAMGLSRENVFLTSALKCRPDVPSDEPGSRPPTAEELQRCLPYLAAQIAIVKPKVIVALGAGAMRALFGSTETVGKLRSRWHEIHGIPVMPTFHPSYLIRNSGNSEKRKVWEDLLQVLERLGRTVTDKQAGFFKSKTGA
jgi:DNA polymerase